MMIGLYVLSDSIKWHLQQVFSKVELHCFSNLELASDMDIHLIHSGSFNPVVLQDCMKQYTQQIKNIGIMEDKPNLNSMLHFSKQGIRAYCNSYMAASHYQQLVLMLKNGHSWYPPHLLEEALSLAHKNLEEAHTQHTHSQNDVFSELTKREKEVVLNIVEGKSNKVIADELGIKEQTVKSHLTNIFKKLPVTDRVSLVLFVKQKESAVLNSN